MIDTLDEQAALPVGPVRRWIMTHDDRWLFIVPYIGLAVLLSIVIGLFWLVVVVAAHFALELLRQHYIARLTQTRPGPIGLLLRALWELRLDIALIAFALVLALHMELTLGLVGLGSATWAGMMAGARFAAIQRLLRVILLSLDDLAQFARVLARRGHRSPAPQSSGYLAVPDEGWRGAWSRADYAILAFGAVCLLLIGAAPLLTDHTFESLLLTLSNELAPFPALD